MMFVSTGLDSQHQSMVDMIEYNHKSGRNRSLYKKIKEQIIIEKLASPGDFSDDFSGQSKLINIALNRSTNIHYWSLIDTEFTQILNDIAVEISGANIRNQKGILKTIKKNTEISDVDFENLKGHIASFNSDHLAFHVNVEWYYTNILIPRMDKKLLFNEVYSNFLSSTVCNITSSTGTVIVSPNFTSEEEKCFYPVKLDNIIPKA
jgi:hypothetical protein